MPKKPSFQDSSFTENVRFYASRSSYSSNNHMECVAAFVLKESLKKWAILECCCVISFPSNFQSHDNRTATKDTMASKPFNEPIQAMEQGVSMIHLREPPSVLRPSETHSEQEATEITITKLLLRSYYDIVRKNIEDSAPKAIMHFLVNHTKRELHNVFIKKLYRDNLFEEMLQEPDEVATKRKRTRETLRVLQQAFRTLDELPLEAESVERGYSFSNDTTGLPKIHGLPTSSIYNSGGGSTELYGASPKHSKSRRSSNSGELHSPYYPDTNGGGRNSMPGLYPTGEF